MKTGKRKYAMSAAFAAFLALSAVSPIAAAYEDNDVDYQFHILKHNKIAERPADIVVRLM